MDNQPHPSDHHRQEHRTDVSYLHEVAPKAMKAVYDTITALMDEYWPDSPQWATLCSARRIVEYEMRVRYGDDEWSKLTGGS